jgi:hypothetical protein
VHLRIGLAECDGLLELVNGMLPLVLENEEDAEVIVDVVVTGLKRDGLFEMGACMGIVLVDPLDNTVEEEDLGVVGMLGEEFGAEGASFVNVVAHDKSAEELEFEALIAGVVGEGPVEELDSVFIAVLVNFGRGERLDKG